MGFMSKLFGKKQSGKGSGKISMFAMTLQQKYQISPRRCGLDGQTFPCPSVTHTVVTGDIDGFQLDVGGYCPSCRDFRCHEHVEFKVLEGVAYGIFCTTCGTRVTGVA